MRTYLNLIEEFDSGSYFSDIQTCSLTEQVSDIEIALRGIQEISAVNLTLDFKQTNCVSKLNTIVLTQFFTLIGRLQSQHPELILWVEQTTKKALKKISEANQRLELEKEKLVS